MAQILYEIIEIVEYNDAINEFELLGNLKLKYHCMEYYNLARNNLDGNIINLIVHSSANKKKGNFFSINI